MTEHRPENSTNVRSVPFGSAPARPALRSGAQAGEVVVRYGLTALGRLSPELAARAAEEIFLTPRRPPRPPAEAELLAGAERFAVPFRGDVLYAWTWGQGPAVLLVHGWEGRGSQLAALVPWLRAGGLRAVAFDAPAHGDSPGRQLSLADHAEAILAVDQQVGPLRGVIAHSFGAASATVALSRGLQTERMVFIAPMLGVMRSVREVSRRLGLTPAATAAFVRRLERRNGAGVDDLEPRRLAPLMTTALLAVVDDEDRVAAPMDAADVVGRWPAAHLVATSGKGHRAILADAGVARTAAEFLAGREIPEPYGEDRAVDDLLYHRDDRALG
jgi:alpha-beta hydrolase superfamily lysophospholipase